VRAVVSDAIPISLESDESTTQREHTIIGRHQTDRRPWARLSPEIVELASEFCAEAVDPQAVRELHRQVMAAVDANNAAVTSWMELACSHVLMLGYQPADCVIEHHDRPRRIRHVLRVRRMECFEVAVVRHWDGVATVSTVIPRVIGWPPPRIL
jgi:hypothetical protein